MRAMGATFVYIKYFSRLLFIVENPQHVSSIGIGQPQLHWYKLNKVSHYSLSSDTKITTGEGVRRGLWGENDVLGIF